jgi:hypothetical protein
MTDKAESLYLLLVSKRDAAKLAFQPWGMRESVTVIREFLAGYEVDVKLACEARRKERKKAAIDERARDILNVYPRREGGTAALQAITKAISQDGFEAVLERTTEYASAVARWAPNRKKAQSGSSLIPLPATWFGNRRYFDDSKAWWEGTGGKEKAKEVICLPEPEGWRFAHPESRFVTENIPWASIDLTTQKWIIENSHQQAHG